jgi:hypothetical protein
MANRYCRCAAPLPHGDLGFPIEGRETCHKGGGGVALDEHPIGFTSSSTGLIPVITVASHAPSPDWPHDVEVEMRLDVEGLQHLVEHLTVLSVTQMKCSISDARASPYDGRKLDGLRPGAENA